MNEKRIFQLRLGSLWKGSKDRSIGFSEQKKYGFDLAIVLIRLQCQRFFKIHFPFAASSYAAPASLVDGEIVKAIRASMAIPSIFQRLVSG